MPLRIAQGDGEFVAIGKGAREIFSPAGSVTVTRLLASAGIEHALLKLQSLEARRNAGQIAGGRVALGAAARAIEVALARFDVACLQIGDGNTAPSAGMRHGFGLARMNERDEAANFLAWRN